MRFTWFDLVWSAFLGMLWYGSTEMGASSGPHFMVLMLVGMVLSVAGIAIGKWLLTVAFNEED